MQRCCMQSESTLYIYVVVWQLKFSDFYISTFQKIPGILLLSCSVRPSVVPPVTFFFLILFSHLTNQTYHHFLKMIFGVVLICYQILETSFNHLGQLGAIKVGFFGLFVFCLLLLLFYNKKPSVKNSYIITLYNFLSLEN